MKPVLALMVNEQGGFTWQFVAGAEITRERLILALESLKFKTMLVMEAEEQQARHTASQITPITLDGLNGIMGAKDGRKPR